MDTRPATFITKSWLRLCANATTPTCMWWNAAFSNSGQMHFTILTKATFITRLTFPDFEPCTCIFTLHFGEYTHGLYRLNGLCFKHVLVHGYVLIQPCPRFLSGAHFDHCGYQRVYIAPQTRYILYALHNTMAAYKRPDNVATMDFSDNSR